MAALSTAIRYNRSDRTFQIRDTRRREIMSTATNRAGAEWLQLQIELGTDRTRDLQRFCKTAPDLTSRIVRAGLMFARQLVEPVDWWEPARCTYNIGSQSDSTREYRVFIPKDDPTAWTCTVIAATFSPHRQQHTCPDIANNAPETCHGRRCKHMILASLHRKWIWEPWILLPRIAATLARREQESAPGDATPEADRPNAHTQGRPSVPQPTPAAKDLTVARYANADPVAPGDLAKFAAFIRDNRRLPHNRAAFH